MTREEALRRVKGYLTDIIPAEDYSEVEEILKALEPEPCGDTISRQAVLKIYNEWFNSCNIADKKESPKAKINALPAVKPVDNAVDKIRTEAEDCISRKYLLDNCVVDKVTMPYVPVSKIENAPPVAPQQKMGMWIENKQLGGRYQCSRCGMFSGLDRNDIEEGYEFPNFCSNCGIKMRKVKK